MHLTDEQLNEYLDNETNERVQIETHLSSCGECAARLSTLQALFTELDSLPEVALTKSLSEASPWDAAPFLTTRSLPAPLPKFLTLTVILQAAFALTAIIIAVPFVANLLPAIEISSLMEGITQLQSQWINLLDKLSTFNLQPSNLPTFNLQPATFQLPSLEMSSLLMALAGVSILWILGNGVFLRNQR